MDKSTTHFNLTRQFAVLSFLCILLIGTVSTYVMSKLFTDKILAREASISQEFIDAIIKYDQAWQFFSDNPDSSNQSELNSYFTHLASIPDVVRANIYSRDRSVLWSSDPDLIGDHFGENLELDGALRGELIYESGIVGDSHKEEHIFFDNKMDGIRFIETYIPVWNQDRSSVIAIVELYKVPHMLHQSIIEVQRLIWLGALLGGLLLFVSLFWIVKRANRVMESQQQRLIEARSLSMIGETASAITHAMRNPLAAIRACAELSLTDDLEGVRESAMDIMNETDRLDRWARELLQFSATNTEVLEQLDLKELVENVVREHEPALKRSSISLQLDMAETQLPVDAHFATLSQVFGNLIMNAVEAMEDKGKLIVGTSFDSQRSQVVVSIKDNGPGLSDEIKDRLFQPFATTKHGGTGLGLPLSRRLVEHYDGFLDIISKPGQGVTVTVRLPVSGGLA